jgi:hypothetical protein
MKKYQKRNIGEVHYSKESLGGYKMEIIDGGSKIGYCTIVLEDKHKMEVRYDHVKEGTVKNPYHKSVFGRGYIGVGKYRAGINGRITKSYQTWISILERIYDEKYLEKYPTYRDVTVCKEWHNFQTFAEWFYRYYPTDGDKYDIDKDLKSSRSKIYSPQTCIFIPQSLNKFMTNTKLTNTSGYIGVCWNKRDNKWVAGIGIDGKRKHIGYFNDPEDASEAYKKAREIEVKRWKRYYSFDIPKYILDNLK